MRVVAGRARGRVLLAPAGTATRPTSDRVREAVFNILSSMDAIEGAPVIDLFAGSGALGIEALSRGAASVTFVDHDRLATEAIAANLAVLGDDGRLGQVVRADALAWVRRLSPGSPAGVVFADPPYAWSRWPELLDPLAAVAGLVVAETGATVASTPAWELGWETVTERRYGSTLITILRPLETPATADQAGPLPEHQQPRGGT
jgi:16S rRNA (guanine966-N2)-methyltransferase